MNILIIDSLYVYTNIYIKLLYNKNYVIFNEQLHIFLESNCVFFAHQLIYFIILCIKIPLSKNWDTIIKKWMVH